MPVISNKKQKIREILRKTKEKRKNQIAKVCGFKISYSTINKEQRCWLERIFLKDGLSRGLFVNIERRHHYKFTK